MKVTVNNDKIIIQNPTQEVKELIEKRLIYKDKSKEFQIKRLSKTSWGQRSPFLKKLQKEVNGKLYEIENDTYKISSCFFYDLSSSSKEICDLCFKSLFTSLGENFQDNRKDTGIKIVLPWVNKPHNLRPYQEEAIEIMEKNYRGLINLATGLGKTLLAIYLIKRLKRKTLIVCPSESVAKQFYEQLCEAFGKQKIGYFGGGKKKISDITVGIAASICNKLDEFKKAKLGLVIVDETHHIAANTFFAIAEGLSNVGRLYGLTATDYRSDGKDIMITAGCGPVLIKRDIKWGIENKWLAEPYFIIKKVPTKGKDYENDKLKCYKEHVLNNKTMKDQIMKDAKSLLALNKSVLILVAEIAHGEELSQQLGLPFAKGEDKKSQEYIVQLNNGTIKGLIGSTGKVGEGSDTKNVDALLMANFIASKAAVIQAVGRALRKTDSKERVLIVDYIPEGSSILSRHANKRISYYKEITDKIKIK